MNCFVEILDRAVVIALIVISGAAVVVDDGQIFRRILACLDKRRASGVLVSGSADRAFLPGLSHRGHRRDEQKGGA